MGDLHEAGFTKDQILDALRQLPVVSPFRWNVEKCVDNQHPAQKRAVRDLQKRKPDTKFICLSNSNEVYISTILEVRRPVSHEYCEDSLTIPETRPCRPLRHHHHQPCLFRPFI